MFKLFEIISKFLSAKKIVIGLKSTQLTIGRVAGSVAEEVGE